MYALIHSIIITVISIINSLFLSIVYLLYLVCSFGILLNLTLLLYTYSCKAFHPCTYINKLFQRFDTPMYVIYSYQLSNEKMKWSRNF